MFCFTIFFFQTKTEAIINKEYKVCVVTPLNTITPSFRTRRYFSRHSYKDNSLQNYPSLVGATFGTHIDGGISFIMPLVHQRKEQHSLAHLYFSSSSALNRSSPCDSNSVFEGVYIVYIKENRATKARFPFQRENNKGVDVMYSRACVASEA